LPLWSVLVCCRRVVGVWEKMLMSLGDDHEQRWTNLPEHEKVADFLLRGLPADVLDVDGGRHGCRRVMCD
jgi:hypothetical protein